MSAAAHDAGSSESSSGYEDGLGRRVLAIDRESGEMRERLRLRPELTAFAKALQERLPLVEALEDELFARPRLIVPEPDGRLSVLSDFVPGRRLCDILDVAGDHGIVAGLDAGLGLLLELLPALSRLHDAGIVHGAIGPGRIMVTTAGQVVLTDAIYAEALERLQLTRRRLWAELRLAFPSTAGSPRFDKAADLTQAALSAAALILGRPLRDDEYPDGLSDLRQEIAEIASIRASKAFADGLDRFFGGALPLASRRTALASADEAAIDIRKLLRKEVGITTCRSAMIDFFQQVDAAERERAEASAVEFARLEAQRIEVERFEGEARARAREDADRRAREEAEQQAREEAERLAREETERQIREEAERQAREEAERRAREEAERKAREEAERKAREEAERKAREEAERKAREEAERRAREEAERKAREEAERKAREEAERKAREEAARKAREEAERRAREEAERKAREEAERKAREEAERRKREEAERKAREEAERRAREEAERKAREEAERKAREEAERRAREEAERKIREEAERKAREEAERRAREEAERKAREEAERKAREEAERRKREEAERKAREEAERKAREEAERKAREEAERKAREEAERRAREEAERKIREEAERKAREEAERQARAEAERKAREEAERRARAEAERQAREEAERKAREAAERKAREEAERIERARLEAERVERERIEAERRERERAEQETADRIERARQGAERAERERIERERADRERADRRQAEWRERDRIETERRDRERAEREERERAAAAAPSSGWLIPPDRAAAFEPAVHDEPPPQQSASAYPIYAPSAETQSWTPEFEPPPAIEIAPVAASTPQPQATIKLQEPRSSKGGIRLKEDSGISQAPSPRAASRHEPLSLSAEGAYEPFSAKEETREIPWKLIAAGLVVIAGTFGIMKGYPGSSDTPKPAVGKAPAAQPAQAPAQQPPPVAANQTRVSVTSDPPGLRVTIDGKAVGGTPVTLDKIAAGKHVLTLQGSGGTLKKTITVVQGQTLVVDVPVFSGFAELSVPFVAEVSENGKLLGTSEGQIILGPGRHLLHLQNKDLNYNSVQTVDIEPGESTRVTVDPRGSANINAAPWAEVIIDGQKAGETPLANVPIRLGVREIIFRNPQFPERRIVTTVKSGVPVTISVDFNKDK